MKFKGSSLLRWHWAFFWSEGLVRGGTYQHELGPVPFWPPSWQCGVPRSCPDFDRTSTSRSSSTPVPPQEDPAPPHVPPSSAEAPIWAGQLLDLLSQHGQADDDDEGPVIYLTSYYIDHSLHQFHSEPRPLRFDMGLRHWESDVRFVWEDYAVPDLPIEIALVRPDPPRLLFRGTIATAIVYQRSTPQRAACLTTVAHIMDPEVHFVESAHSVGLTLTAYEGLQIARVSDLCHLQQQQGFGQCPIHVGHLPLPPAEIVHTSNGLGLTIRIPPAMTPNEIEQNLVRRVRQRHTIEGGHAWNLLEDDQPESDHPTSYRSDAPEDEVSLMARRPTPRRSSSSTTSYTSSSTSSMTDWRQTVIFLLDGRSVSASLPWHDSGELLLHTAQAIDLPMPQVLRVHRITHRPLDFVQMGLLLLQRSTEFRPTPFVRIVLLDLELHVADDVQPTPFQRHARWLPYITNRKPLFRALGLASVQQEHQANCHLWKNHVLIDRRDEVPLRLADGDYLKIFVGDMEEQDACLSADEGVVNVSDIQHLALQTLMPPCFFNGRSLSSSNYVATLLISLDRLRRKLIRHMLPHLMRINFHLHTFLHNLLYLDSSSTQLVNVR